MRLLSRRCDFLSVLARSVMHPATWLVCLLWVTQCDRLYPQTLHYNHVGRLSTVFLWGAVSAKAG